MPPAMSVLAWVRAAVLTFGLPRTSPASGGCETGADAFLDQRSLELRQRSEDVEHQLAGGRRRVHVLGQRAKADLPGAKILDGLDELAHGAGQAIELPDDQCSPSRM